MLASDAVEIAYNEQSPMGYGSPAAWGSHSDILRSVDNQFLLGAVSASHMIVVSFFIWKISSYLFPVTNLEGPQCEFSRTVSWMKFENKQDYDKYFSRLDAFPNQVRVEGWLSQQQERLCFPAFPCVFHFIRDAVTDQLSTRIPGDEFYILQ